MNYRKVIAPAIVVMFTCAAQVMALPTYEPFSNATASGGTAYANGTSLYRQTNASGESWAEWNGGSAASWVACTNSGLSYAGFPAWFPAPSLTNAVHVPGNSDHAGGISGLGAALTFSKAVTVDPYNLLTNSVYASFLLKMPNIGTLNSSGPTYFAGFGATTVDQTFTLPGSAMKIFLKGNAATAGQSTTWSIGVANNSGGGSTAFDGGGHGSNDVVFVVVDYEFGVSGNPDVTRLWVNPAASSFGAQTPPTAIASANIIDPTNKLAQAADFFLLDRTGSTLWGGLTISDLRLGMSWSYVTGGPEIAGGPLLAGSTTNGKFVVNGTRGTPGMTNFLLSSTNVSTGLGQWAKVATNLFDGSGRFSFANTMASAARQFYTLEVPPALNSLWIPDCGALLGAACSNGTAAAVSYHENQIGRKLDVLRIYHTPGSWTQLTSSELSFINAGRRLLESVKPDTYWSNCVGVANGGSATVDAQMTTLAKSVAAIKPAKIMLIVWHEPENDVIGSVPSAKAGTTTQYVEMWHNVRSIFDANGATNVIWCWDTENYAPLRYLLAPLWPGNNYVDWVMWDEYQDSSSNTYTNVIEDGYTWMAANSTVTNNYLSKPWGLAEWGVGINSYTPTVADQTNGINGFSTALNLFNLFPKLKLIEYFAEGQSALIPPEAVLSYSNFANSPYLTQQCSR